jgi:hypothetical protein
MNGMEKEEEQELELGGGGGGGEGGETLLGCLGGGGNRHLLDRGFLQLLGKFFFLSWLVQFMQLFQVSFTLKGKPPMKLSERETIAESPGYQALINCEI